MICGWTETVLSSFLFLPESPTHLIFNDNQWQACFTHNCLCSACCFALKMDNQKPAGTLIKKQNCAENEQMLVPFWPLNFLGFHISIQQSGEVAWDQQQSFHFSSHQSAARLLFVFLCFLQPWDCTNKKHQTRQPFCFAKWMTWKCWFPFVDCSSESFDRSTCLRQNACVPQNDSLKWGFLTESVFLVPLCQC